MTAFTHLCGKVNISLAHSTMTIYSKNGEQLTILYHFFTARGITPPDAVHRGDHDHHYFHDDKFHRDKNHYHMKFPFKITEDKLANILNALIDLTIINQTEKQSFLVTYQTVNNATLERFHTQLTQLQHKAAQLSLKAKANPGRYGEAATEANKLFATLQLEANVYMHNKGLESYELFNERCNKAIRDARPILEKHRGYTKLFGNIAAAILGLGIIYLIATTVNYIKTEGKHFFFDFTSVKTDSIEKLEQFQEAQAGLLRV